jgi:hypothetical protein
MLDNAEFSPARATARAQSDLEQFKQNQKITGGMFTGNSWGDTMTKMGMPGTTEEAFVQKKAKLYLDAGKAAFSQSQVPSGGVRGTLNGVPGARVGDQWFPDAPTKTPAAPTPNAAQPAPAAGPAQALTSGVDLSKTAPAPTKEALQQRLAEIDAEITKDDAIPSLFKMSVAERMQKGVPLMSMSIGERNTLKSERDRIKRQLADS